MRSRLRRAGAGTLAALAIAGCSASGGETDELTGTTEAPVYAMATLVWSDGTPTGYVALTKSLDDEVQSLDDAREFPGYASIGVVDGQLLVNPSWEDLGLERYRITDDLRWADAGGLSFVNEGVEAVSFHTQYMRDDHAAYLDVDVTGRVLWDSSELRIERSVEDDVLERRVDGLELYANLNRTQFVFGDRVVRPFSYHDQDWFRWSPNSKLVVYDRTTHEPAEVIDAPCPALDSITEDEAGNTYLGTQEYSALQPLMGTGAAPCAVRLRPDLTLDESWTTDFTSLTEGRYVVNFRYVGRGKAIGAVLHAEEYGEDFDFESLAENGDDFWANAARYHRLWMFDLEAASAVPVAGIDDFEFINPGFFHAVLDGRTFVFLGDGSNGSYNFNETAVYEIDDKGEASKKFVAPGSVIQWLRIR